MQCKHACTHTHTHTHTHHAHTNHKQSSRFDYTLKKVEGWIKRNTVGQESCTLSGVYVRQGQWPACHYVGAGNLMTSYCSQRKSFTLMCVSAYLWCSSEQGVSRWGSHILHLHLLFYWFTSYCWWRDAIHDWRWSIALHTHIHTHTHAHTQCYLIDKIKVTVG